MTASAAIAGAIDVIRHISLHIISTTCVTDPLFEHSYDTWPKASARIVLRVGMAMKTSIVTYKGS